MPIRRLPATLDFKSNNLDGALLDLFTYNTASPRSGIVSLNTRNSSVLAAIIKGALPTEAAATGITNAQATSAATSIISASTVQPAMGRQDVSRLASAPASAPFTINEENRETIARALAEVGQTRTWGPVDRCNSAIGALSTDCDKSSELRCRRRKALLATCSDRSIYRRGHRPTARNSLRIARISAA